MQIADSALSRTNFRMCSKVLYYHDFKEVVVVGFHGRDGGNEGHSLRM